MVQLVATGLRLEERGMSEHPSSEQKLSHYIVAWGSIAEGSQVLNFRTKTAALRAAKKYDADCKRNGVKDVHRVFAVYVQEIAR